MRVTPLPPVRRHIVAILAMLVVTMSCGDMARQPPTASGNEQSETGGHVLVVAPQNAQASSTVRGRVVAVDANANDFTVLGPVPNVAVSVHELRPAGAGEVADTIGRVRGQEYGRVLTNANGEFMLTNVPAGYLLFTLDVQGGPSYRTVKGGYLGIARAEVRDHILYVWNE